ncbi:MAG: hypothetical protein JW888_12850 [Pirellulales bacterium]|nr:hypothetical protein [Pirellulales bacterium]
MKRLIPVSLFVLMAILLRPAAAADVRYPIHFPDLPGYTTLKCDFHIHTVFSDGQVWPTVRVREAWRQGLDGIAITDHIEYSPHKKDVSRDLNRVHDLAAGLAKQLNLLLIRGGEITKDTPPGHFNTIFVKDMTPLNDPDIVKQARLADEQGGFMFWNHPLIWGGKWTDVHDTLYKNQWLRGVEVCNGPTDTHYLTTFGLGLEKNLTLLGNSDMHVPDLRTRNTADDHRTMTLVFARQRTVEGVHEALLERRTLVWFHNEILGRTEWLAPLFERSIRVSKPTHRAKGKLWIDIENLSEANMVLRRAGNVGPTNLTLPARSVSNVEIRFDPKKPAPTELPYTVTNFLVAPDKGLSVTLNIPAEVESTKREE